MKHVHSLSLSATWRLQNNEFYLYLQEPCDLEAVILLCLLESFLDKWHFPWFTGNSLSCSEKWHFFIRPQISSDEVLILFLSSPLIRPYFWGGGLGHPGLKITHTSQSLQALLGLQETWVSDQCTFSMVNSQHQLSTLSSLEHPKCITLKIGYKIGSMQYIFYDFRFQHTAHWEVLDPSAQTPTWKSWLLTGNGHTILLLQRIQDPGAKESQQSILTWDWGP